MLHGSRSLTFELKTVVVALVLTRLDYATRTAVCHFDKTSTEYVQCFCSSDLRTPAIRPLIDSEALTSLHWLRISERMQFKLTVLVHTELFAATLQSTSERLLGCPTFQVDHHGDHAPSNHLLIPPVRRSSVHARAFHVSAFRNSLSLPSDITPIASLPVFRRLLKKYLFCHPCPGALFYSLTVRFLYWPSVLYCT